MRCNSLPPLSANDRPRSPHFALRCGLTAFRRERGNEAFKAGDFPKALAEYSEAIKRDPDTAVYYVNRAAARTKLMDFSGALADCDKVRPRCVRKSPQVASPQAIIP
jgi:tetratricopeptide (TPR) repeat protein